MQRLLLLGISVVLVVSLASCAEDEGGNSGPAQPVNAQGVGDNETEVPANPTAGRTGALPDGGTAYCVESYTPKALTGRAFAFDGVVLKIGASVSDRGDDADLGLPRIIISRCSNGSLAAGRTPSQSTCNCRPQVRTALPALVMPTTWFAFFFW